VAPVGPAVVGGGAMRVINVWLQFPKLGVSLETLGRLKFIRDDVYDGKLDRLEDLLKSCG